MSGGGSIASAPIVVLITCSSITQARRLARALVDQRATACVNIVPGLTSFFRWKGRVEQAREILLVAKTTRRVFPALTRIVLRLHSYDVPEIIALPVTAAHAPYQQWLVSSVRSA